MALVFLVATLVRIEETMNEVKYGDIPKEKQYS